MQQESQNIVTVKFVEVEIESDHSLICFASLRTQFRSTKNVECFEKL